MTTEEGEATRIPAEQHHGAAGRIGHLDGIRALAVLAVIGFHWNRGFLPGVFGSGYVGVDVFLVLSGFLITGILVRKARKGERSMIAFLRARVRRLYPALLAMVAVVCLVYAVVDPPGAQWEPTLRSVVLTLTQLSWIPVVDHWTEGSVFSHAWTLAVEWSFYLVWPFILWWAVLRSRRPWLVTLVGCVAIFVLCAWLLPYQWFYASPIARCAQLGAGCALALYLSGSGPDTPNRPPAWMTWRATGWLALGFLVLWMTAVPEYHAFYTWIGFPAITLATVLLIVAGGRAGWLQRLLNLAPLRGIGRASYSLYLWHVPWIWLGSDLWPGTGVGTQTLLLVGLTLGCATISYWLLERPYFKS